MITQSIVFDHRGRSKAGQEGPVEVRVTVDRKPYYINTGIRVRGRELFDGQIIDRGDSVELNERLRILSKRIMEAVNRCVEKKLPIDVAEIKRQAYGLENDSDDKTAMYEWIKAQVPILPIKAGTKRRYDVLLNRMKEYGKLMAWDDLSVEAIYQFDVWLHQLRRRKTSYHIKNDVEPDYIDTATVWTYHKLLKAMLYRAMKTGIIDKNPYDLMRGEFDKGVKENVEYLTESEIAAIESLKPIAGTQIAKVRDLFIFQLYTGLSYSDTQAFDINNYKCIDGRWVAVGQRIKTGVPYISELLPQAVEVLERYGMEPPRVENGKYNVCLKTIQHACGITTNLHSHLARHTFATMALKAGAKIENVSKMLGHTNITQTQRYAKVLAESVREDYEKLRNMTKKSR